MSMVIGRPGCMTLQLEHSGVGNTNGGQQKSELPQILTRVPSSATLGFVWEFN